MLIERKADINNREGNGFTPLMLAAMRGNFQVAALLLEKGADMTAVNKFGKNAPSTGGRRSSRLSIQL